MSGGLEMGHTPHRSSEPDLGVALGRRVRARRRQIGATQRDLAGQVGVSYQQVQRFECGASQASAAMVWKLAEALGVSVGYLYGDERPLPDEPIG